MLADCCQQHRYLFTDVAFDWFWSLNCGAMDTGASRSMADMVAVLLLTSVIVHCYDVGSIRKSSNDLTPRTWVSQINRDIWKPPRPTPPPFLITKPMT
jgi:hypothetical protein